MGTAKAKATGWIGLCIAIVGLSLSGCNALVDVGRAPGISPEGGPVLDGALVSISTITDDLEIYYTLDGSIPTAASTPYKESFKLSGSATPITVQAISTYGPFGSPVATAVFTFPPIGTVSTMAGSVAGWADGTGTAARFKSPSSVLVIGDSLYITDTGNNRIRLMDLSTLAVTTFSGSGTAVSVDGSAAAAGFNQPFGLAADSSYLYVSDMAGNKVRRVSLADGGVTTLAGTGTGGAADGAGAASTFLRPAGLVYFEGFLYVADSGNSRIRRIDPGTATVTTLTGSAGLGNVDGSLAIARFWGPLGIAADDQHLIVADTQNYLIRRIDIEADTVSTIAGGKNYDGSRLSNLDSPAGLYLTTDTIWVANAGGGDLVQVTMSGTQVWTYAGAPLYGLPAQGTPVISSPYGVTAAASGYLILADTGNSLIRRIE